MRALASTCFGRLGAWLACAAALAACGAGPSVTGAGGTGGGASLTGPVVPPERGASVSTGPGSDDASGDAVGPTDPSTAPVDFVDGTLAVELCAKVESRDYGVVVDDSNSMGSPAYARALLRAGLAPDARFVRPHEFMNYYRAGFDAPAEGTAEAPAEVALSAVLVDVPNPTGESTKLFDLHIAIVAPTVARAPVHLTLAIDASGSMKGEGILRAREAASALVEALGPDDLVTVLQWSAEPVVLVEARRVAELEADGGDVIAAIAAIEPDGESNMTAALARAYELAEAHRVKNGVNRVVVVSDGGAQVGDYALGHVASVSSETSDDVQLVGVGVGSAAGYRDEVMNALTEKGRGAYVFVDSLGEAERVLRDRFDEVMRVAVTNLSIQVQLPGNLTIDKANSTAAQIVDGRGPSQNLASGDEMNFVLRLTGDGTVTDTCEFDPSTPLVVLVEGQPAPGVRLPDRLVAALGEVRTDLVGASRPKPPLTYFRARAIASYALALDTTASDPELVRAELRAAREAAEAAILEAQAAGADEADVRDDLDEIATLVALHPLAGE